MQPTHDTYEESLTIIDNRTGEMFKVPIENGRFLNASVFKQLHYGVEASGKGEKNEKDAKNEKDGKNEQDEKSEKNEKDHSQGHPQDHPQGHSPDHPQGYPQRLRMFDPAFLNTAVVRSKISYVDGEKGILLYRGYRIEDLLKHSNFLEVAFLLIYGELPDRVQSAEWEKQIMTHTYLHVKVNDLMKSFNYDAHPMGMFISSMAALSTFHPEANPSLAGANIFVQDIKLRNKQFKRIIGKATTLAANAYRHRIGREFNNPQNGLGYTENFLCMLDRLSEVDFRPHPVLIDALDKLFIIHAEHEMNCSTTAMRLIGSSLVDPYSAISGAAAALYGPLHGGATEAVVHMLEEIGTVDRIFEYIEQVKRREKKLMGFGHRVYKNFDPRASLVRGVLYKVFEVCGKEPLMEVAVALEQAALNDEYFVSRKLYPNVDFYSGLIYKAMGFPTDFFPLLFAIPRISGWLAHWNEMLDDTDLKIWRPRQVYIGEEVRPFVPMDQRPIDEKGAAITASHSQAMYKRYALSKYRDK